MAEYCWGQSTYTTMQTAAATNYCGPNLNRSHSYPEICRLPQTSCSHSPLWLFQSCSALLKPCTPSPIPLSLAGIMSLFHRENKTIKQEFCQLPATKPTNALISYASFSSQCKCPSTFLREFLHQVLWIPYLILFLGVPLSQLSLCLYNFIFFLLLDPCQQHFSHLNKNLCCLSAIAFSFFS